MSLNRCCVASLKSLAEDMTAPEDGPLPWNPMLMDKRHDYSQQIDKAAKIIDLRGDVRAAIKVLEGILNDTEIQYYPSFELEALVFLAGIHLEAGKFDEARRYVQQVDRLDLGRIVGEEIRACLYRLKRIKKELAAL